MKKAYSRLLTQHAVPNGTHGLAGDGGRRCSAHARHGGRCRVAFEIWRTVMSDEFHYASRNAGEESGAVVLI